MVNVIPFAGMRQYVDISVPLLNLGLNLLLFVPFGFFLSLRKALSRKINWITTVMTGFFFSLIIEILQFTFPTGRAADIDDVIFNTLGMFVGFVLWKIFEVKLSPKRLLNVERNFT